MYSFNSTKAGLDEDDHFKVFDRYDDALTFKLIGAVCEVLGKPIRRALNTHLSLQCFFINPSYLVFQKWDIGNEGQKPQTEASDMILHSLHKENE